MSGKATLTELEQLLSIDDVQDALDALAAHGEAEDELRKRMTQRKER